MFALMLTVPQMFTKIYPEMMSQSPTVEAIVRGVWDLLGAGKASGVANDAVRPNSISPRGPR